MHLTLTFLRFLRFIGIIHFLDCYVSLTTAGNDLFSKSRGEHNKEAIQEMKRKIERKENNKITSM